MEKSLNVSHHWVYRIGQIKAENIYNVYITNNALDSHKLVYVYIPYS